MTSRCFYLPCSPLHFFPPSLSGSLALSLYFSLFMCASLPLAFSLSPSLTQSLSLLLALDKETVSDVRETNFIGAEWWRSAQFFMICRVFIRSLWQIRWLMQIHWQGKKSPIEIVKDIYHQKKRILKQRGERTIKEKPDGLQDFRRIRMIFGGTIEGQLRGLRKLDKRKQQKLSIAISSCSCWYSAMQHEWWQ